MRIFTDQKEAFKEIERDLWELGETVKGERVQSQDVGIEGWTMELLSYTYSIPLLSPDHEVVKWIVDRCEMEQEGDDITKYIMEELKDRTVSIPTNPGHSYIFRKSYWQKYLSTGGKFAYTYSERMFRKLGVIKDLLLREPFTRQAVLGIWNAFGDLSSAGSNKDVRVPCSMYYHFTIREQARRRVLNLEYVMRSCDLYQHFVVDQTLAMLLGMYMVEKLAALRLSPGRLAHHIGSLHAFYADLEKRGIF